MAAMLMPVGADPESGSHTVTVKIADGQESRGTVKINVITVFPPAKIPMQTVRVSR